MYLIFEKIKFVIKTNNIILNFIENKKIKKMFNYLFRLYDKTIIRQ